MSSKLNLCVMTPHMHEWHITREIIKSRRNDLLCTGTMHILLLMDLKDVPGNVRTFKTQICTGNICKHTFTGHFYSSKLHLIWTFDIYSSRINTYNYSLR